MEEFLLTLHLEDPVIFVQGTRESGTLFCVETIVWLRWSESVTSDSFIHEQLEHSHVLKIAIKISHLENYLLFQIFGGIG